MSSSLLKKKDSYIAGQQLAMQSSAEAAKDEGNVGTPLSTSFRPVTLTVQAFFKQVYYCCTIVYNTVGCYDNCI